MLIKRLIERIMTFIVLGYFVFVADVGSWWSTHNLAQWYSNYILWAALIVICFVATREQKDDFDPDGKNQ